MQFVLLTRILLENKYKSSDLFHLTFFADGTNIAQKYFVTNHVNEVCFLYNISALCFIISKKKVHGVFINIFYNISNFALPPENQY